MAVVAVFNSDLTPDEYDRIIKELDARGHGEIEGLGGQIECRTLQTGDPGMTGRNQDAGHQDGSHREESHGVSHGCALACALAHGAWMMISVIMPPKSSSPLLRYWRFVV